MASDEATLMIAGSETDSDMLYDTGFLAPDPFIYVKIRGRKILMLSDLEIDRAKAQAKVHTVQSLSQYMEKAKSNGTRNPGTLDALEALLKERKVKKLLVPAHFGVATADRLRKKGFRIRVKPDPFHDSRILKTEDEIKKIIQSLRHTEAAIKKGLVPIREGKIRKGYIYHQGRRVTSEQIKNIINTDLMQNGLIGAHTIISSGEQCCEPHDEGHGPIRANATIIFDVFPRSHKTMYYADITRSFFKGVAPAHLKKMYKDIRHGQDLAMAEIRHNRKGSIADKAIRDFFEAEGYFTGLRDGRMHGFFHGTGHGLGLDVHEAPRVSRSDDVLRAGMVVTVEPGLYYPGLGGIRLEDLVVVTRTGVRNLTKFPKVFEIP